MMNILLANVGRPGRKEMERCCSYEPVAPTPSEQALETPSKPGTLLLRDLASDAHTPRAAGREAVHAMMATDPCSKGLFP